MSDHALRSGLIRLAHTKPELRPVLLPLLTKRAEYGMKPTESELQSMQEIIHVWGKALAAALGGHASVVEQSSASQIIMAVTLPDLGPNATIRAHVGMLKGEFVVGMFEWGVPSFVKEALGRDWLVGYRYSGTPEEVMRPAARTAKEVARTLEPMREQAGLRRDADAVFGQVMPKLHAWVQKALSPLAVAGPLRVSGGANAGITGQGVPYAKGTLYVSGLISRADAKDKNHAEMVLEKANEVLARALPHFNHDGVVAALAPERASWTADLYQVPVVLYFKKSPVRLAAGQPNYADLTKRLLLLLGAMSPPQSKMVEAVAQTLQAWATTNGLDARHNLVEIAEDLLYNAYRPGKPIVDARQVLRVMQEQYPTAFTSRVAAAGIPVTLKKKLSLKDGTVIEAGEKGTLRFNEQTPRQAVVDFDVRPNTRLGTRLLGDYFGRPFMKEPSMSALENMGDGIAKSVTGKKVEPDGYGPDGSPSWLLALGYI